MKKDTNGLLPVIIFGSMIGSFLIGVLTGASAFSESCNFPAGNIASQKIEFCIPCDTIHLIRSTTYQPTIEQCDSTPFSTASGAKINPDNYQRWCAISRDLHTRYGGEFDFGDTLDIYSKNHPNINGQWVVQDLLSPKHKMSIDFLMEPYKNIPKLGVGKDVKIISCGNL